MRPRLFASPELGAQTWHFGRARGAVHGQLQDGQAGGGIPLRTDKLADALSEEGTATPADHFCTKCGGYCGDFYTGFTHDHFSDRGPVWCDRCLSGEVPAGGWEG
jgi:hypothetical protein